MRRKKNQLTVMDPSMIESALGPSPVLESEDPQAYKAFRDRIFDAVAPRDAIEQMLTAQFVNLSWEYQQYGALKAHVIKAARPKALEKILAPLTDGPWRFGARDVYDNDGALKSRPSMELANDFIRGDTTGIEEINETLRQANLTMKDVDLHAMDSTMDRLCQISQLMSQLEGRAKGLLREVEHHRRGLADALRGVDVMDGELKEIA